MNRSAGVGAICIATRPRRYSFGMSDSASDELLALQARDPAAQRAFWLAERPRLLTICLRILRDAAQAEAVADQALVDFMFRRVMQLNTPAAARTYLRLMTSRLAVRRRDRLRTQVDLDSATDLLPTADPPDEEVDRTRAKRRAQLCFGKLGLKAQRALRLRYGEGLTQAEIGTLLGGSKQYMGRLLRKSVEKIRECMKASLPRSEMERT